MVVLCVPCAVFVCESVLHNFSSRSYVLPISLYFQLVYNEIAYIKRNGSIAAFNKHILVFIIIIILGKRMPKVKCVTVYA